jgi:hypothetical protein
LAQVYNACSLEIYLYLTPLGQARQFIETFSTQNPLCGNLLLLGYFVVSAQSDKRTIFRQIFNKQAKPNGLAQRQTQ